MPGISPMTQSTYQTIAAAVREHGENACAVSRATGIHRGTIGRALKRGWPEKNLPPLGHRAQPQPTPPTPTPAVPTSPTSPEERAIAGALRNSEGAGVALTKILQKLVEAAPRIMAKLDATGDNEITAREYLTFVRDVAKATESLAKANAQSIQSSRVAAGVPNEVRHLHAHAVVPPTGAATGPAALSSVETDAQIEELLDVHRRLRAYQPGSYRGEEVGIAPPVETNETDSEDGGDAQ